MESILLFDGSSSGTLRRQLNQDYDFCRDEKLSGQAFVTGGRSLESVSLQYTSSFGNLYPGGGNLLALSVLIL